LPNKPTKNKQPVRLIMNNKSISAYTDDSISTEVETLILDQTHFSIPSGKTSCFILSNKTRRIEICNLGNSNSIAHMNFVDEWKNDFDLFKNQCNNKEFNVQLDPTQEKDLQNELNSKIEQAKLENISEKNKLIKIKSQLESPNSIDKIQEMGMLAVRKEMKFGELLINEENLKEKQEIDELTKKIKSEKAKEEMLMKSIKEKEMESELNLTKSKKEQELENIKEMLKKQIITNRESIKQKILLMRKRNERVKQKLKEELQDSKMKVAEKLSSINKEGDINSCFKPTDSEQDNIKIQNYCKINFIESDPQKYSDCLKHDNYCYTCCEREFGEILIKKRNQCYDKCDFNSESERR
jgi:hypothetical protein